jgi:hypothetical protein
VMRKYMAMIQEQKAQQVCPNSHNPPSQ